jgi:membrane protein implicated in regulation of membrane protease activity
MRTLGSAAVFLLLVGAVFISQGLMGIFSWREPWTWVLALAGAAIYYGIVRLVYKRKPEQPSRQE